MGQYYYPTIIRRDGTVDQYLALDYDNGLKLMEHSYIGNHFVDNILHTLFHNKGKLAWLGDYTVAEDTFEDDTIFKGALGLFASEGDFVKRYSRLTKDENFSLEGKIILNHSKKEYIVMSKYIEIAKEELESEDDFIVNPVPLLTASSNGRGGGDYRGVNEEYCGLWCGDIIEVGNANELIIYQDYQDVTEKYYFEEC